MKKLFLSILVICCTQSFAKVIKWQKIDVKLPKEWKAVQTPMPSLHGYFLNTEINKEPVRFFVYTHKPLKIPTSKFALDYWSKFSGSEAQESQCKKIKTKTKHAYQCTSVFKDKATMKWSMQTMFWLSDIERLFVSTKNFKSEKEAYNALKKIEVDFK
jgi:hypothetical protein